jgi:hypothetical protein
LIYLFKYPGLIFSELLGLIFLAAFVAGFRAPSSTRRTTATGRSEPIRSFIAATERVGEPRIP